MAVPVGMPDHALLTRARDGDGEAFEALYRRHHRAATRAAHSYSSRTQLAEDAVQEAFLRILHATQEGGGPQREFRAYLATTVRHVIAGWTRGERTVVSDDLEMLAGEDVREGSRPESRLHWHLLTRAFKSLPTRWQEALWLGEVEGISAAELAERWNMSANSAAALCYRARDGLRTAWLDAHVNEGLVPDGCRPYVTDLSRYTQGKLTDRRETQVRTHLEDCEYCRAVLFEVDVAASELRVLLLPVALWGGLALAGGGAAVGLAGVLQGLTKTVGNLGTRGLAVSAGAAVTVVAVVVAVAMNAAIEPGAADPTGAAPDTSVTDSADDPDQAADDPDVDPDDDATDNETDEPAEDASEPPADDPTSVPIAQGDPTPTSTATVPADTSPSADDPTDEPTKPMVVPPGTDPTDDPEPTDEPAAPDAPDMDYTVEGDSIVLFGSGEPGATITVQPAGAGVSGGGGGGGAAGRTVMMRVPMDGSGAALATTSVDSDGTWTVTPNVEDVAGLRITAIQTTTDGRISAAGIAITMPSRPAAPVVTGVGTTGTAVTIEGTGTPGSTLRIHQAGVLITSTVSSEGHWTVDLRLTPALSGLPVWASQVDLSGLSSARSAEFALPEYVPPPEPEPAPATLTMTIKLVGGDIVFGGEGEPGASISVAEDGTEIAAATVDPQGFWEATIEADPALSGVTVIATQVGGDEPSQRAEATVPEIDGETGKPPPPSVIVEGACLSGTSDFWTEIEVHAVDGDPVSSYTFLRINSYWKYCSTDDRVANGGLDVFVVQIVDGVESDPSEVLTLSTGGVAAEEPAPEPAEPSEASGAAAVESGETPPEQATTAATETLPEEPTTADATETGPAAVPEPPAQEAGEDASEAAPAEEASEEPSETVGPEPPVEVTPEQATAEEPSEDVTVSDT